MAQIIRTVNSYYRDLMDNKSDPRVKDWPLMSGPMPTFLICISFVYFVKYLGPSIMENRKPYKLTRLLVVYNFFQVCFSSWLFYESVQAGWFTSYSFRCQPVDYSRNPKAIRAAAACWFYYISKFTEFFDTIFFVMRKKYDHVSTLHVTHHAIMPMSVWFGVKFTPGGHSTFFGMLNTFVHIIMYTYYMFAAMGPQFQKYLWWKKYLTAIQMVQFVLVMAHAFQLLFIECDYPTVFAYWIGGHAVLFYFLFSDFYKKAYSNKVKADAKKESDRIAAAKKNDDLSLTESNSKEPVQNGNYLKNGTANKTNGVAQPNGSANQRNGSPKQINGSAKQSNGSAKQSNGSAKQSNGSPKQSKSKMGGFFGGFVNICQMDHSLLYEDDPPTENGSST